jgi:hypothetical protein
LDLQVSYTTRDYTSQITITHRPLFSVMLLPMADVPLLPGSRPCRLATIPRQPRAPNADSGCLQLNCSLKTATLRLTAVFLLAIGPFYKASVRAAQKTPSPMIPIVLRAYLLRQNQCAYRAVT